MKLCVIGNSHTGMIAQAAREAETPNLGLTFFAKPGRGPEGVRLRGTELRAARRDLRRSLARLGMPDRINIPDFDGFVIVGMTASMFTLSTLTYSHAVLGWASSRRELTSDGEISRPLVSESAIEASICASIEENLAYSMIRKIRRVTHLPVVVVPQPHPSAILLQDKARHRGLRDIFHREDGDSAARVLQRVHDRVFLNFDDVTVLRQPQETIEHGFLTRAEFTHGARRLNADRQQPPDDVLHANSTYGRLMLNLIAQRFAPDQIAANS